MTGIYEIVNVKYDRSYIGMSTNIEKKIEQHLQLLRKKKHHSKYMQHDYDNSGIQYLHFNILHTLDKYDSNILKIAESEFIQIRQPYYNIQENNYSNHDMTPMNIRAIQISSSQFDKYNMVPHDDSEYINGEFNILRHERELIIKALNLTRSVVLASKLLKIPERTVYRKIFMHQLQNHVNFIHILNDAAIIV